MLYIVPTPIGNIKDASPRIIAILSQVDFVLAEDTRNTGKLFQLLGIKQKFKSFHAHNEHQKLEQIIDLLKEGKDLALVSDAGTPAISDPGFLLVRSCHENDIKVSCLPGPTAFIPALAASGIPSDKFFFEGFLPQKKGRQTRLKELSVLKYTFILYESPYRLLKCLKELIDHCGPDRKASVSREISKIHEEVKTDSLINLLNFYNEKPSIKGEIVLVVGGFQEKNSVQ